METITQFALADGTAAPVSLQTCEGIRMAVAAFTASQDIKPSSRGLYGRTLRLFFDWVAQTGRRTNELTSEDIYEYRDTLFARGRSALTVGSYLTSLRKFYEWLEGMKVSANIMKSVKTPKRRQVFIKQHLTEEKSRELLSYFQGVGLRNYAIVNLMLRTGLRTIEVVRAKVGDITFKGGRRVLKVWGKGRDTTDDFVVLTDKAYEPIAAYLNTRGGAKPTEPLFTSTSNRNAGGTLTTRTISGLCKEGLRAIGLDDRQFSAHSLRHTTAVVILKRSRNIRKVQEVLRHTSPETSQIYVRSIEEELRLKNAGEDYLDKVFR